MKIVIGGIGKTGNLIANYLSSDGHSVTIIDEKEDIIRNITDNYEIAGVVGSVTSIDSLLEADIKNSDIFLSLTSNDEANILACTLADIYGVPNKIAKISNSNYLENNWQELFRLQKIPVNNFISNWHSLIINLRQKIKYSYIEISDIIEFAHEEAIVFSIIIQNDCLSVGKSISDLINSSKLSNIIFKICGIFRNGDFFIPSDESIIKINDKVFIATVVNNIDESYNLFYTKQDFDTVLIENQNPYIVLYGDHPLINKIAIDLSFTYGKIKVIKNVQSKDTIIQDAILLEKYKIKCIQDDILTSSDSFNSLNSTDTILILFNENDEDTVLNTLLLNNKILGNIFCCLNNSFYENFLISHNIHNIIVPDSFIMSSILTHIRRGLVDNIYSLYQKAEIIEIEVSENSAIIGKRIGALTIPNGSRVCHIIDDNKNIINFNENTIIRNGYKIIYLALRDYIQEIENMFNENFDF